MAQRVRWHDPLLTERAIDQTQLVLDDGKGEGSTLSFLVMGDTGSSRKRFDPPQRKIAQLMLEQSHSCRFVLHTGDVVYMVGSSEQYLENFIKPYHGWICGGERPHEIPYDQMVFSFPVLPVLGNHDYYDLPWIYGFLAQLTWPLRWLIRFPLNLDVGWHGSYQGDAYARAFLDYLRSRPLTESLTQHLDRHYTAPWASSRCLRYRPGHFTRLPNRYYSFHSNGIDFFALDSNTFNTPLSSQEWGEDISSQTQLQHQRQTITRRKVEIYGEIARILANVGQTDHLDDLYAELEQIQEVELDIEKQVASHRLQQGSRTVDVEQLNWLRDRLIQSWRSPQSRGRILYLHHPPYVTESSKWNQGQTLAVRHRLRQVLDQVLAALGSLPEGRPLVDLVFTGHAHCFEHLQTLDTSHGDARVNWIICGGSGFSLRRQRTAGSMSPTQVMENDRVVAESHMFIGRTGHGWEKRRAYTFARVDVTADDPPRFQIQPFVLERYQMSWKQYDVDPFWV